MQKTINKISYLDGIRGVAAFIVVLHHFCLAFYTAYYTFDEHATHLHGWDVRYGRSLYSVFASGNFCVFIFFVLSGFVLSRKYYKDGDTENLVSGAQRRFVRLYLPVLATLLLSFILMECYLYYNKEVAAITHSEWWFGGFWNFTNIWEQFYQCVLYRTMFTMDATFDTSMWSISVEFYGSLFVFAFLALTHHTRNRVAMLLLSILYCYYTNNPYLAAFVLGIALNYAEAARNHMGRLTALTAPTALLVVALVLGSFPCNNQIIHTFYSRTPDFIMFYFTANWFHALGAYLFVLAFVLSPRLQRFMSRRLFLAMGYISFAIYLLHPIVLGSVSSLAFLRFYPKFGYNHSAVYVLLLTLAICVPAAWLMTRFIDEPGVKLARHLYKRYVQGKGVGVAGE